MQSLRLWPFSFLVLLLIFNNHCGGGSSGSDTSLSVQASVTTPSLTSSLTAPRSVLGTEKIIPSVKLATETAAEGVTVHAEDFSGTEIGEACETDSTGKCDITGLTQTQIEEGFSLVYEFTNDSGNTTSVHAPVFLSDEEVTQVVAGETVTEPVNTETDMIQAMAEDACGGNLEGCNGTTLNIPVLVEAVGAMITGDTPDDTTTIDGAMQALYETHAAAIAEAAADTVPKDILEIAFGGDTTGLVTAVGETVTAFDTTFETATLTSDAATGVSTTIETYATVGDTTWIDLKASNTDFSPAAIMGCIAFLPPNGVADFTAADFREVAKAIPEVDGGFAMMAIPDAQNACAQSFQQGLYDGVGGNPEKAGAAFGTMTATFPPCPPAGCGFMARTDFTALSFDPVTAGLAASNGFLALGTGINYANFLPDDMRTKLNDTLSDRSYMQSFANGGGTDFFAGLATTGSIGNFVPATFLGDIKAPPGGSCTANTDCLPCDSCSGGQCVSGSSKMGAACSDSSDCDDMTSCRTGPVASLGGVCMCASVIPTGAFVIETAGAGPSSYTPPSGGTEGAECGTGLPACSGGRSCSGTTFGVCVSGTFKKGPYMSCSANSECESNSCSGSVCTIPTNANGYAVGIACSNPSECASFLCSPTTGLCEAPPTTGVLSGATGGLKANGLTCTGPSECVSAFCCTGTLTCTQPSACSAPAGGTGPIGGGTLKPAGMACFTNGECSSGTCLSGVCGS